jgi:hypothetical protein
VNLGLAHRAAWRGSSQNLGRLRRAMMMPTDAKRRGID